MRIKRNDISVTVYQYTSTVTSDGMSQSSYTVKYASMAIDLQPVGSKFDPAEYGINSIPSNVKKGFYDIEYELKDGMVILLANGSTFMVKGIDPWYGHNKAIFEQYEVTLP